MPVGDKKERVDFGRIIGTYKDLDGNSLRTSVGMICYSKKAQVSWRFGAFACFGALK